MNWVFLAILAPAIYTINNFVDKYLVSNKIKDYKAITIYSTIVGFGAGTIIWLVTGRPLLNTFDAGIVILTGILTIWGLPIYFKALSEEETTTVIILFQTIPLISLILAFFILGETVTAKQFLGFITILMSVILATFKKTKTAFSISPVFFYVLIFNTMWALAGVLIKFAINANSFTKILPYESWGIGIGGLILFLLFPSIRNAFLKSLKNLKKSTINVLFVNEVIFVLGKAVTFLAYSLGPVALVSVIGGTQVFFGLIYGFILTTLFPKLFDEDLKKETLIKKGFLACLVVLGIYLLN